MHQRSYTHFARHIAKVLCVPGMVIRPFRHTLEINGKLGQIQVLLSTV